MPSVAKEDAVERLVEAIQAFPAHDLAEVHNELFPFATIDANSTASDPENIRAAIADYLRKCAEPEEIVDCWNVVFPEHHHVRYDESEASEGRLEFFEESDEPPTDDSLE